MASMGLLGESSATGRRVRTQKIKHCDMQLVGFIQGRVFNS